MLSYFHLCEVHPDINQVCLSDFQEVERGYLTLSEAGDLFFTLQEYASVVVGARISQDGLFGRSLRDLHFYSVDLDRPEELGPLIARMRAFEGPLTVMPSVRQIPHASPSPRNAQHARAVHRTPQRNCDQVRPVLPASPQPVPEPTRPAEAQSASGGMGRLFNRLLRLCI